MSFILDAIKKSEDERRRSKQPDLHSLQEKSIRKDNQPKSQKGRFTLLIIAMAILSLGAWWLWPQISGQLLVWLGSAQSARMESSSIHSSNSAAENVGGSAQLNKNVNGSTVSTANPSSGSTSGYAANDQMPPRNEIKELWELPADFQAEVPSLEFSFHVYSREPEKRTIIINGRRVREGQMVASGLKLRLISDSGVILHFRDHFFHVDVIEKW